MNSDDFRFVCLEADTENSRVSGKTRHGYSVYLITQELEDLILKFSCVILNKD